jgi:uncharacterized coiled-coil protein SlyX
MTVKYLLSEVETSRMSRRQYKAIWLPAVLLLTGMLLASLLLAGCQEAVPEEKQTQSPVSVFDETDGVNAGADVVRTEQEADEQLLTDIEQILADKQAERQRVQRELDDARGMLAQLQSGDIQLSAPDAAPAGAGSGDDAFDVAALIETYEKVVAELEQRLAEIDERIAFYEAQIAEIKARGEELVPDADAAAAPATDDAPAVARAARIAPAPAAVASGQGASVVVRPATVASVQPNVGLPAKSSSPAAHGPAAHGQQTNFSLQVNSQMGFSAGSTRVEEKYRVA